MPETATGGVLWKKMLFYKISQNLQETLVTDKKTCEFCKIF